MMKRTLVAVAAAAIACAGPTAAVSRQKLPFTIYWAAYASMLMREKVCTELVAKIGARTFEIARSELLNDAERDGHSRDRIVAIATRQAEETLRKVEANDASRTRLCADSGTPI